MSPTWKSGKLNTLGRPLVSVHSFVVSMTANIVFNLILHHFWIKKCLFEIYFASTTQCLWAFLKIIFFTYCASDICAYIFASTNQSNGTQTNIPSDLIKQAARIIGGHLRGEWWYVQVGCPYVCLWQVTPEGCFWSNHKKEQRCLSCQRPDIDVCASRIATTSGFPSSKGKFT